MTWLFSRNDITGKFKETQGTGVLSTAPPYLHKGNVNTWHYKLTITRKIAKVGNGKGAREE